MTRSIFTSRAQQLTRFRRTPYSFCNNHHVLFCSLAVLDPRVGYTTMRTVKTELGVKGEDSFIKPVFFSQILLSILYSSGNVNVK